MSVVFAKYQREANRIRAMISMHRALRVLLFLHIYSSSIHSIANGAMATSVKCLPSQSSSLLQLKRSFGEEGILLSWQPNTDCCHNWEGVTCDMASGHVVALDLGDEYHLQSNGLDPALFNLTLLRNLSLSGNDFGGSQLPASGFERLSELVHLDLFSTNFVGQIPIGIASLNKLRALDLSNNPNLYLIEPSFQTFIANLSNLRELYLDSMDLSRSGETWSSAIALSVPHIQILSLMSCGLSGSIDPSLSRLHSLVMINLRGNYEITGMVPEFFANFSFLTILDLSGNNFEGQFPTRIFQLKRLRFLDLGWNDRLCVQLPEFPSGSHLEVLNLVMTDTNCPSAIPVSLVNLKSLKYLGLSTEGFSRVSDISFIGKLQSLEALSLYGGRSEPVKPEFSWIGSLKHLTELDLYFYDLSGPVPSCISNLTNLTSLTLNTCNISGPIPSWIGSLAKLSDLILSNNSLTGKIPGSIFALPMLQSLYLDSNQLSGHLEDIPTPSSSSISEIDLSNNQLGGPIPTSFYHLPSLSYLNLESNHLIGTLELNLFWRLINLQFLGFSNNMLSVTDAEDSSLPTFFPNIQHLGLASCNLTKLPSVLRYLNGILELDLSSNRIGGTIPGWIWEIWKDSLGSLDLSNNEFIGLEKFSFIPMTHLSYLNLSFNRLQGDIPIPVVSSPYGGIALDYSNNGFSSIVRSFGRYLNSAIYINLSKNKLNGRVPTSICGLRELQILDLSYNKFRGPVPHCLLQGGSLSVLKLMANRFQGMLPDNIKEGCMFETLDLNSNRIGGKLPRSLSNCKSLELLDVGNNQIADSFPSWLGILPKLRVLVLRSNQFFGMVTALEESDPNMNLFSSLQILDLASNNLSGNLPQGWFNELKSMIANDNDEGQILGHPMNANIKFYRDTVVVTFKGLELTFTKILTTFKVIDLSMNLFDGPVPESLGRLDSLHGLNMSHNNFTGQIPSQLGKLSRLESMDLSWNHLSGEIPLEFTSLTSLAWLNLSYNNLTGTIPQGNQFLSFPSSSFEGNAGLCGSQVSKQCDNRASTTPQASDQPESNSLWQDRLDAVLLFTFAGLGFGAGFALAIMFQHFYRVDGWTCKRR